MSTALIGHHEILFLAQGTASLGLAGWAAAIGARGYAITNRRTRTRREPLSRGNRGDEPG